MNLIETKRLQLRHLSLDDLPQLTKILSDPKVMQFSLNGICDEAATQKFIEWSIECYDSHGFGPLGLVESSSSQLCGFCGVYPEQIGQVEEVGLGYRLDSDYWNKGFATEAGQALVRYTFENKKALSIVALIDPENTASIRVLEKIRFNNFKVINFHDRSVRLYRLDAEQWVESQAI